MTSLPTTTCECGKPMVFAKFTKADGSPGTIPLDAKAPCYSVVDRFGEVFATRDSMAMVSHFATCTKASKFSSSRGQSDKDEIDSLRLALQRAKDEIAVLKSRLL